MHTFVSEALEGKGIASALANMHWNGQEKIRSQL